MHIGPYLLSGKVLLAPMAGVTDAPFRRLCRRLGAAAAASEMVIARAEFRTSRKTRLRAVHADEAAPRIVQIAGTDPAQLADAARWNVDQGAQIIDINMGCPAKKVCNVAAGSALLRDERLVGAILDAVVRAVPVPVTLKTRTGWAPDRRNGVRIAQIAAGAGIAAIAIHGRTRQCLYGGSAEYDTIAAVKRAVRIPVIANGDIDSPAKARAVLDATGADAVMIGRAAHGNPFIFRAVQRYLDGAAAPPAPGTAELRAIVLEHIAALHDLYGPAQGVRVARKHLGWYLKSRPGGEAFWARVNRIEDAARQFAEVQAFLDDMCKEALAA